jgi:LysM repeat protein
MQRDTKTIVALSLASLAVAVGITGMAVCLLAGRNARMAAEGAANCERVLVARSGEATNAARQMSAQVAALRERVSALATNQEARGSWIERADRDRAGLAARVGGQAQSLLQIESQLAALKQEVESVRRQTGTPCGSDTNLLVRLQALERVVPTSLQSLNRRIESLREMVDGLTNRVVEAARPPAPPPPKTDESGPSTETDTKIHRIKAGETIERIAKQYGVTVEAIRARNPRLDPRRLQIGQELSIP